MNTDQLPVDIREFAAYLSGLLARLNPYEGWYGVFRERDPEGLRACAEGLEVPPWDVVESLLQDLAALHGAPAAEAEHEAARALHIASAAAYDARPGGREALGSRLDFMAAEQRRTTGRLRELRARTPLSQEEASELEYDLAWTEDDHVRARARCGELQARLAELDRRERAARERAPGGPGGRAGESGPTALTGGALVPEQRAAVDAGAGQQGIAAGRAARRAAARAAERAQREDAGAPEHGLAEDELSAEGARPGAGRDSDGADTGVEYGPDSSMRPVDDWPGTGAVEAPGRAARPSGSEVSGGREESLDRGESTGSWLRLKRRSRGGARYAGGGQDTAGALPETLGEEGPARPGRTPTGARFAGVAEESPALAVEPESEAAEAEQDPSAQREIAATVDELRRLRAEGRTGEAHSLLAETAQWPESRYPHLAVALRRAGLASDWDTLLWEASSLPTGRLVAVAHALMGARHEAASTQLLRQAAARPADELGESVLELVTEGRGGDVRAVLDAFLRARSAQDAASLARVAPRRLVPLLRESAAAISPECAADLGHALRVAGIRG
ncbi:hypothetical protein HUT18_30715 [Streptomyces sp. NA04227]|uniref:hypothetical protein n=1 Tax=Streptomyces sp. NA04227 TaxID=2742136 RepID=UPI00159030CC|nr:hypothetical protein [Streptomyces sp. NA04227]QKW10126.1 hypothetical protein HUT18_30715 [Streptomyces sp. NA04227]